MSSPPPHRDDQSSTSATGRVRVLFAGDTHGATPHVVYLLRTAQKQACPKVFVVGDFGFWEHTHEGRVFLDKVNRLAHQSEIDVAALDGNHDNWSLVLDTYTERDDDGLVVVRDHIRYAPRGHRWTWGTTRILALGGAASLDKEWRLEEEGRLSAKAIRKSKFRQAAGGAPAPPRNYAGTLWFPDEELSDDDVETVLADGTPVDLLLTHDKPRRSRLGFNRKDDAAAWPNQERVQRVVDAYGPARLVHGHLHVRYTDRLDDTAVEGLACDYNAGFALPGYRREDSWMVLEL